MTLTPLEPTDTRQYFRPVCRSLAELLPRLSAGDWMKTAVGTWHVRDVVAHLTDITMRRLSFDRDRHTPPPPPSPIQSDRDFVRFINQINADWVGASRRLSTRQLSDLYDTASRELADFVEALPFDAPGLFGVSWAGEMESAGWFDIGREFTEQWHHQAQIREAAGAAAMQDAAWLQATLLIALRGLPHAFRNHDAATGTTLTLNVTGPGGGIWTLQRGDGSWVLLAGQPTSPSATVTLSSDAAWRLLFNGLSTEAATAAMQITGDARLAGPLVKARSIVI